MNSDETVGLFGPGSEMWRLFGEQVLTLFAGGRALLLQVAHPLVAAGVEQHSNYREDPWGRLTRTLDVLLGVVFGSARTAREKAERLERRHAPVTGLDGAGRAYSALDPDLMLWVHATLIESALVAYEGYVAPLSEHERDRFYAQSIRLGEAFGIPRGLQPADRAGFDRYWQRILNEQLEAGDTLQAVARTIMAPPPPGVLRRLPAPLWRLGLVPAAETVRVATVGTLPPQVLELLGWRVTARDRLELAAQQRLVRAALPLVPAPLRYAPHARAARRRVGRATGAGLAAPALS